MVIWREIGQEQKVFSSMFTIMNSRQQFYDSVKEQMKRNQWDHLALYQDPFVEEHVVDQINEWLLIQLLIEEEFTKGVYDALHRLFGSHTPSEWTSLLVQKSSNFPAIHALLDHGELDLRCPDNSIVRYVLHHGLYDSESKRELLEKLFTQGADVNEQEPRFRSSLLNYYIDHMTFEMVRNDLEMDSIMEELHCMVPYLLQKGADPLLKDRNGQDTIEMVQKYHTLPPTEKAWLLTILERHSS